MMHSRDTPFWSETFELFSKTAAVDQIELSCFSFFGSSGHKGRPSLYQEDVTANFYPSAKTVSFMSICAKRMQDESEDVYENTLLQM